MQLKMLLFVRQAGPHFCDRSKKREGESQNHHNDTGQTPGAERGVFTFKSMFGS